MRTTLKRFSYLVLSEEFLLRHRKETTSFTRQRKLPFSTVLALVLRKSVKSLQVILNEWCRDTEETITASALSQARQKFSYTAFIELLEECVVRPTYSEGRFKKFKGHRLLAIDGSTLRLPTSKELIETFGTMRYMNGRQQVASDNVEAKVSVLYDVLNEIPLCGSIHEARTNDIRAATEHLETLELGDIVMADRGYCSYAFFSEIRRQNADFVVRIRDKMYHHSHQLFCDPTKREKTAEVVCPVHLRGEAHIATSMHMRFIRVDLPDGEIEVLATSLLDRSKYPQKLFKQLYYKRWRIETFYQALKSRLAVDNFTGRTVEAIKQDFFSTLFISGLETVLAADTNNELAKKRTVHTQQVNKAISFHAIKDKIILLMFDPPNDFQEQVRQLFLLNPTLRRENRKKEKERLSLKSNARSLHFQKFARKTVF
jgi:hypothetical protein